MVILEEGEKIIRVVHRHWFVVLSALSSFILLSVLPILAYKLLTSSLLQNLVASNTNFSVAFIGTSHVFKVWFGFFYSLWVLILWSVFFVDLTDYYLDMLVLTDRRVININQNGFFRRETISFNYGQIQDVTVEVKGILQTFFKFGLIQIQTAGETRCIVIKHADNPEDVRSEILKMESISK